MTTAHAFPTNGHSRSSQPVALKPVRRPAPRILRGALYFSVAEGAFATVTQALITTFAIPALLVIGAGEMGVAALTGCFALLCALAQLFAPRLGTRIESRRSLVFWLVLAQGAACFIFAATGFLPGAFATVAAVAAYGAYGVFGHAGYSPWASWMSDLVPPRVRSRHFALRGLLMGVVSGAVALGAGYVLRTYYRDPVAAPWTAFALIFSLAGVSRLASGGLLRRQFEPPVREKPPLSDFSYLQFLSKVGRSNFANFTICFALLHGAAYLTNTFFQVYLIRDLGYGYDRLALLPCCALLSNIIFVRFWGRVAERWGNRTVLRLCTGALAVIPVFFLLPPAFGCFLVAYLVGGACWAGVNLASFNYVMEAATPRRRMRCYAFMMATVLLVMSTLTLSGGWMATRLPVIFEYRLQTMFLLAAVIRLIPAVAFALLIKELSDRPAASPRQLFWELPMVQSTAGLMRYLAQSFRRA